MIFVYGWCGLLVASALVVVILRACGQHVTAAERARLKEISEYVYKEVPVDAPRRAGL